MLGDTENADTKGGFMTIDVRDNRAASRFEAALDGELAVSEYTLADGVITFTHTEVPSAFQGRGVASQLISAALASARERKLQVVPHCAAVVAYMRRHPETYDLLTPAALASLKATG